MHVQILLLINVVAHVAYCQENDDLFLEFGTKTDDEHEAVYKEIHYFISRDYPTCGDDSAFDALIPKINDQDSTLKLTTHYLCHNYNFKDVDIPGHSASLGIIGGLYWYNSKKSSGRVVTANVEHVSSLDYQSYSHSEGQSIQSTMHSISADAIDTPRIEQNYFLYETGKEKLFVKLKLDNALETNSRLFVKVLGPIITDSDFQLRGVVWKMSCTVADEKCKSTDITINEDMTDEDIVNQLNFVRKIQNVDNVEENKDKHPKLIKALFEQEYPSYSVTAYQCNSDGQCSAASQIDLNEKAKEDEVAG